MHRHLCLALLSLAAAACVDLSPPPELGCDGGTCDHGEVGRDHDEVPPEQTDGPSVDEEDAGATADASDASPDAGALANGVACSRESQCASGVCADGVCCATRCPGLCMSCNARGVAGTCVPVSAGDDPDQECVASDSNTCGQDGTCDGMGACRRHPAATPCGDGTCTNGTATPPPTCDGAGACRPAGSPNSCGKYQCGPSMCLQSCSANSQCTPGNLCSAGACVTPMYLTIGGTITAASALGAPGEEVTRVFDQNLATKWFVRGNSTAFVTYRFAGTTTHVVLSYRVASANDNPDRDPRSWVLEGSNDGTSWVLIDAQSNQIFSARQQLRSYDVMNTAGYNRYRYRVIANNGSLDFQMSELQLFGY